MARRIESYYIRFNEDVTFLERFALYAHLYSEILHKDKKWHYFTEGTYDELRFDSKFKRRVNRLLDRDNRVSEYAERERGWVDDQKIVEEHKEYFTEIFHQNTLLSLELFRTSFASYSEKNLKKIMDRVAHSFFNMIYLYTKDDLLESKVMSSYLLDRAWYTGYLYGTYKERNND